MADNVLGYKRTRKASRIISSDNAGLTIDGELQLVQSAQVNYGHQVIPRFEAGSSELYWAVGQAQGRCTVQRAVSSKGFWGDAVKAGDAFNGTLFDFQLAIKNAGDIKDSAGTALAVTANETLSFGGAVVVNLTASITTGSLEVSDGVEIAFAEATGGGGGA